MRRITLIAIFATALFAAPAAAQRRKPPPAPPAPPPTDGIEVTVVDIAGAQAFLKPGAAGGVHRGAIVKIHGKELTVVQTTSTYAVVDIGDLRLREDEKGRASIVAEEEEKARELPKPKPLATWQQAWTPPAPPASAQTPKYVPLGESDRDRRYDVRLSLSGGAMLPLSARSGSPGIGNTELNARVHAEPIQAPLSIDVDLTLQRWFASNLDARDGHDTRPLLWVREALVSYASGGYYAGLGRMRYAASTLGTLDGARVKAPLGSGFSIGAFGGVLPNPLGGEPSLDAQRFGVEATYSRPEIDLRPEGALVVQGSTFGGSLDERRISGIVGLYPGNARLGGHFEVSNFESGNPFKARPIELTAAGLDASVRAGVFEFGARIDARQPERSRWLASFLPLSWFCRTITPPTGSPPGTPEPCDGSVSTRTLGQLDASVSVGNVSAMVGATRIADLTQAGGTPDMSGAFVAGRLVRIARILRIDLSGSYTHSSYAEMVGGSGGPGLTLLGDNLDVSAYYRRFVLKYPADVGNASQSGIGSVVMLFPNAELLFTMQGEAVEEIGTKMLVFFGTAMWRPRF